MKHPRIKLVTLVALLTALVLPVQARELAGISLPDEITLANGDTLILNGMGLREKLWVDVYVGALYLGKSANNVAEVLAQPGAMRIQMNFVYKEVASSKLVKAWTEGFEKNQPPEKLKQLQDRIDTFYGYFADSAKKDDVYIIDYLPGQGSSISKNGTQLGVIEGEDFRNALIEIWLGNSPADKGLKKGMLGLD